mgnify:CR=1 FL=1
MREENVPDEEVELHRRVGCPPYEVKAGPNGSLALSRVIAEPFRLSIINRGASFNDPEPLPYHVCWESVEMPPFARN